MMTRKFSIIFIRIMNLMNMETLLAKYNEIDEDKRESFKYGFDDTAEKSKVQLRQVRQNLIRKDLNQLQKQPTIAS